MDSVMKEIYTDEILNDFKRMLKLARDKPATDIEIDSYIEQLRSKAK